MAHGSGEVVSCAVYYSWLNREIGIPVSFECVLRSARAGDSLARINSVVGEAVNELSRTIGSPVSLVGLQGWEYIGRSFNLYSYTALGPQGLPVSVRAVERGGYVLGVYGAMPGLPGLEEPEWPGGLVAGREALARPILMRPVDSGVEGEPEGQKTVSRNPIYAVEGIQEAYPGWRVEISGMVDKTMELSVEGLLEAALEASRDPFHCVTGWSLRGRTWEGIRLSSVLEAARPRPGARWVAAVSSGGYASIFPIEHADRALLVLRLDGKPLPREMGAPVRLFVPGLYGWKHVKWVTRILVLPGYADGYWEALAYHERGLVAARERFKVRNLEVADRGEMPPPSPPKRP